MLPSIQSCANPEIDRARRMYRCFDKPGTSTDQMLSGARDWWFFEMWQPFWMHVWSHEKKYKNMWFLVHHPFRSVANVRMDFPCGMSSLIHKPFLIVWFVIKSTAISADLRISYSRQCPFVMVSFVIQRPRVGQRFKAKCSPHDLIADDGSLTEIKNIYWYRSFLWGCYASEGLM